MPPSGARPLMYWTLRPVGSTRGRWTSDTFVEDRCYLVETFFHHLKRSRPLASRYGKSARNFLALATLALTFVWLPPD